MSMMLLSFLSQRRIRICLSVLTAPVLAFGLYLSAVHAGEMHHATAVLGSAIAADLLDHGHDRDSGAGHEPASGQPQDHNPLDHAHETPATVIQVEVPAPSSRRMPFFGRLVVATYVVPSGLDRPPRVVAAA